MPAKSSLPVNDVGSADSVGRGRRIVLGVGGGIAAYKSATLLRRFTESGFEVTVVPTQAALRFVGEPTWSALSGKPVTSQVWDDVDQVRHVALGQRADLVVIAPATADLLARAAHGIADDLLTNVLLTAACPVVMAPAMHTEMWTHPATVSNVATLRARGVHVIDPASGRLTGADSGPGRMPEPEDIFASACAVLDTPADLAGLRVVVSAGGTREPVDPVRFLGNRSSGKQGYALAAVAAARGAQVTVVSANVSLPPPAGVRVVAVENARELRAAVFAATFGEQGAGASPKGGADAPAADPVAADSVADVVIMAAAVADFRPAVVAETKIKKSHDDDVPEQDQQAPVIHLVRNPDVLADLAAARAQRGGRAPLLVGFAAETGDEGGDVLAYAREKLIRKGADLLVANQVGTDLTFGQDSSTVYLLRPDASSPQQIGPASKYLISEAIWNAVGPMTRRS